MPHGVIADHFLESEKHKKYQNVGLVVLALKIRGQETKMASRTEYGL